MTDWSPESKLGDSSFTGKFLIEKLKNNCEIFNKIEENFEISNIKARDISEGHGYLSKVYKCDFSFVPKDPDLDPLETPAFSVVLKEPGMQSIEGTMDSLSVDKETAKSTMEAVDNWITTMHHNESTVYRKFSSEDFPIPKFYGSGERISKNQAGYLIIEFLENAYFPELHEGLNTNQTKNLVDFVMDIQTAAIKSGDWWKKELTFMNFGDDQDPNFASTMLQKLCCGKSQKFIKLIKIYEKLLIDKDVCINASGKEYSNLGLPELFIHGDMWTNNISFKMDPSTQKPTDEIRAVVDWQVASAANPFLDISRILTMCCSPELRRTFETNIVEYYMTGLEKRLKPKKLPFSKMEIKKSKNFADVSNLVFLMFMCVFHYKDEDPETKKKQNIVVERLENLMEDLLPMMKTDFPHFLN